MSKALLSILILTLTACVEGTSDTSNNWYHPPLGATWQMQITAVVNTSYTAEVYVIDMFDSSPTLIADIQSNGRKVICYFSAGSYEDWRPDIAQFTVADLGNPLSGWPGEYWLDIRSANVRSIMKQRLDIAVQKGCDGVGPDNLDGYANNSGFNFSAAEQVAYDRFIANEAHKRNLAVGSKNDIGQTAQVLDVFDFAINEQCFALAECDLLTPFVTAGKPVFNVEFDALYVNNAASRQSLCTDSVNRQFSTLILPWNLDDTFRYSCR